MRGARGPTACVGVANGFRGATSSTAPTPPPRRRRRRRQHLRRGDCPCPAASQRPRVRRRPPDRRTRRWSRGGGGGGSASRGRRHSGGDLGRAPAVSAPLPARKIHRATKKESGACAAQPRRARLLSATKFAPPSCGLTLEGSCVHACRFPRRTKASSELPLRRSARARSVAAAGPQPRCVDSGDGPTRGTISCVPYRVPHARCR